MFLIVMQLILMCTVQCVRVKQNEETKNWTTCKEFLRNSQFNKNDIIDVTWSLFYQWSLEENDNIDLSFQLVKEEVII